MNIFATYSCPIKSAEYLDDKRATKMCVETAQILSTALWKHGSRGPYRVTHKNHPVVLWAALTRSNYLWTLRHFEALCQRYTRTYGKIHKSSLHLRTFIQNANKIPTGELTPFVNCARNNSMGVDFTGITDVHEAYRRYLGYRWEFTDKKMPTWGGK